MLFSDQNLPTSTYNLKIGNQIVDQVGTNCKEKYFKFVGHVLDDKLSWKEHIQHISKQLESANFGLNNSINSNSINFLLRQIVLVVVLLLMQFNQIRKYLISL